MKNKKGFALKDFLAIILVFSIITLITTLTICIIVKENRKNSFKTGLQNVIASVETKCLMEQLKNSELTKLYTFTNKGIVGEIDVKGTLPTSGTVRIDDNCNIEINVSNKYFCANKSFNFENLEIVDLKDGKCIGFDNDISKKINIDFVGNINTSINDLKSYTNKNNELVYEFSLKNNSTNPINYKLQFDDASKDIFKYLNMKVIKDYVVEYDSILTKVDDGNTFEIANIESNEKSNYKIIFKANSANFKFDGIIKASSVMLENIPNKVTVTMASNSKNEKNFTWHSKSGNAKNLQIVKATNKNKSIASFDDGNVIEAYATVDVDNFSEYVYKVKVFNLESGTEYYYRVGSKDNNVWSNVGKFKTDDGDDSFKFLYMADLQSDMSGVEAATYTIVKAVEKVKNAEFLINTGDFVNVPTNSDEWNGILKYNSFGNITSATVAGNHDYDYIEINPYVFSQHFNYDTPSNANIEGGMYYSFDYGNVHFTAINVNDYMWWQLSEDQIEWLKKDLSTSQDKDFRIIIMHRGVYTPGPHFYDYGDIGALTEQLTPIFDKYNVDLVLQGHDHTYGLTYPINDKYKKESVTKKNILSKETNKNVVSMVKPGSPVYFINNAAGSKFNATLVLKDGKYISENPLVTAKTNLTKKEIDEFYSKFQKIATPMKEDGTNLALFSSIEVKGKTLLVNTYSVDNQNFGKVELYDSFGITK